MDIYKEGSAQVRGPCFRNLNTVHNEDKITYEEMILMYKIYSRLEVTENDTQKKAIEKIVAKGVIYTTVIMVGYAVGIKVLEYVVL